MCVFTNARKQFIQRESDVHGVGVPEATITTAFSTGLTPGGATVAAAIDVAMGYITGADGGNRVPAVAQVSPTTAHPVRNAAATAAPKRKPMVVNVFQKK